MADGMYWMDVQARIDKAKNEERWSRNRHVESVEKDLRREFRREVMELREEVGELIATMETRLTAETQATDAALKSIRRTLDERTADRV